MDSTRGGQLTVLGGGQRRRLLRQQVGAPAARQPRGIGRWVCGGVRTAITSGRAVRRISRWSAWTGVGLSTASIAGGRLRSRL
ncbi:hypothetical protein [Micromonospora sp. NPDC023814]|uniref:hypothetical protein n=1 Tax=Micromonospora sp. NPDC023814 TaxID=3154596 RepID=UPI0033D3080A